MLAFGAAALVILLGQRDAALRDRGVSTTASVVEVRGERQLRFTTKTGRVVQTSEPDLKSGNRTPVGGTVDVVYDPSDPTHIVTDQDTTARDITLWIVAGKFLICGIILTVVGHDSPPASLSAMGGSGSCTGSGHATRRSTCRASCSTRTG